MAYTFPQRAALAVIPRLAAALIVTLGSTLRYEDIGPRGDLIPGPTVFVFWHRSLLLCAHRFRNLGIAILISQSFDGELIARTVERLGFVAIRGSSSRGGPIGLRGMVAAYEAGHICALTADGPRGPALRAKPGAVQLAQLAGAPWIGAFEALPTRAWRLGSWDHFVIPKPFSRVTIAWPNHSTVDLPSVQQALDQAVRLASEPPPDPS